MRALVLLVIGVAILVVCASSVDGKHHHKKHKLIARKDEVFRMVEHKEEDTKKVKNAKKVENAGISSLSQFRFHHHGRHSNKHHHKKHMVSSVGVVLVFYGAALKIFFP